MIRTAATDMGTKCAEYFAISVHVFCTFLGLRIKAYWAKPHNWDTREWVKEVVKLPLQRKS